MNSESSPARRAAAARSIIHLAPSRGSCTTCRLASDTPTFMGAASAAAGGAARDAAGLDELQAGIVRALEERDAAAIGKLDRPLQQPGAKPGQPRDVRVDVDRVEAEV